MKNKEQFMTPLSTDIGFEKLRNTCDSPSKKYNIQGQLFR